MLKRLYIRMRLLFRKDKEPRLRLRQMLGFWPHDLSLYRLALRHKSLTYQAHAEGKGGGKGSGDHAVYVNNERLEFLGDAVLSSVVADELYRRYPNKQEGYLTTLRSKLVRRDMLNKVAVRIGLHELVHYSGKPTSSHNCYMNGNAFEAFVGAIYLDRGYKYCQRFVCKQIFDHQIDVDKVAHTEENYKSRLIEWCQKNQLQCTFEVVSEELDRKNNTSIFHSQALIEGEMWGEGDGFSKKESHQHAAEQAFRRLKKDKARVKQLLEARKARQNQPQSDEIPAAETPADAAETTNGGAENAAEA